jgi:hypothetical protein
LGVDAAAGLAAVDPKVNAGVFEPEPPLFPKSEPPGAGAVDVVPLFGAAEVKLKRPDMLVGSEYHLLEILFGRRIEHVSRCRAMDSGTNKAQGAKRFD